MATRYAMVSLEETTSTQDLARTLVSSSPALVVAQRQTGGRGRSGARWENAPAGVAASLAVRMDWPPETTPRITLVAGVAAARALGPAVSLKWPNDLMIDAVKVGGILTEAADGVAVVGIGVNLHWPDPPSGIGAVSDKEPRRGFRESFAQRWAEDVLAMVETGPGDWPLDEYRERCSTLGQTITWVPDGIGQAVGIDPSGALLVETERGPVSLTSGAVTHIRTSD
jgi:BirA family biotin operon repressor/biotin-[acetyl-CoA-carboxylase] ligase